MQIAVVGAGIIGCAIAHELASRGAAVTVFERRSTARGASWASAGVLAPWIEAHERGPLLDMCAASLALFDDFVERVKRDGGAAFEYARPGTLEAAFDDSQSGALQRTAAVLSSSGIRAAHLTSAEARELEPGLSDRITGGLHIAEHGFVEMPALVAALAVAARMRGATFESPVDVTKIEPAPRGAVRVHAAEDGQVFDHVVIAAGSWANRLRAGGPTVRPVKGQLVRLKFDEPPATRVLWSEGCYMVPWRDGTVLVGATMEDAGFDERPTAGAVTALIDAAATLLPAARDAAFVEVRAGLRPSPAEQSLPHVGRSPVIPNVTLATGHFRNGVLLAPLTAQQVATQVLEDSNG